VPSSRSRCGSFSGDDDDRDDDVKSIAREHRDALQVALAEAIVDLGGGASIDDVRVKLNAAFDDARRPVLRRPPLRERWIAPSFYAVPVRPEPPRTIGGDPWPPKSQQYRRWLPRITEREVVSERLVLLLRRYLELKGGETVSTEELTRAWQAEHHRLVNPMGNP
jgi:hypothetical protein